MSNHITINDDEINIFGLLQTLWKRKWVIGIFIFIAILSASIFIKMSDPVYESRLKYKLEYNPPGYTKDKILIDFKKLFFAENFFERWKKKNSTSSLNYEQINVSKIKDGYLIAKDKDDLFVNFLEVKGNNYILIKSNNLSLLDDIFNYANFVNITMKSNYVSSIKNELEIIEKRLDDNSLAYSQFLEQVLRIDRFKVAMNNEANILNLERPTMPIKISPKSIPIIIISTVLGGILGAFAVFTYNLIHKHKKQTALAK